MSGFTLSFSEDPDGTNNELVFNLFELSHPGSAK